MTTSAMLPRIKTIAKRTSLPRSQRTGRRLRGASSTATGAAVVTAASAGTGVSLTDIGYRISVLSRRVATGGSLTGEAGMIKVMIGALMLVTGAMARADDLRDLCADCQGG